MFKSRLGNVEETSNIETIIATQRKKCKEILLNYQNPHINVEKLGPELIHIACEKGYYELVSRLIEKNRASVFAQDSHKREPIYYAAQGGHGNIIQLLLDNQASVNAEDDDKYQPINLAANSALHTDTIELLLRNKADPSQRDGSSSTPLLNSASFGNLSAVQLLIENNASVNEKNEYGTQAIHYACTLNNKTDAVARFLLDNTADIEARGGSGYKMTPLEHAGGSNHKQVMQLLLERGADDSDETLSLCPYPTVVSNIKEQRAIYEARKAGVTQDIEESSSAAAAVPTASAAAGASLDSHNPHEFGAVNTIGNCISGFDHESGE